MNRLQRYVSEELTHLVGFRLKENEHAQYCLLKKILDDKKLCPSGNCAIKTGFFYNSDKDVIDNEMLDSIGISFSDIPIGDLDIHIEKYGKCGLSFKKSFIAAQGGKPVHYIPTKGNNSGELNSEYFRRLISNLEDMLGLIWSLIPQYGKLSMINNFDEIRNFINYELLGHLKFYDLELSSENEKNYYLEREWRVLGQVNFKLSDIERIYIPREFAESFREDFPEYYGQITFTSGY